LIYVVFFPNYCFAAVVLIATNKVEYIKQRQVGQLSQPNRAAACISFGENISAKGVKVTSLSYGAKDISKCWRARQLLPLFKIIT